MDNAMYASYDMIKNLFNIQSLRPLSSESAFLSVKLIVEAKFEVCN